MPAPIMAMSVVSGKTGVERWESRGCGWVRQKEFDDVGWGNVSDAGRGE